MDRETIDRLRRDYAARSLDEAEVGPDPFAELRRWIDEAVEVKALEPLAMHLATVGPEGRPAGRVVLLRGLDPRGLTFYTNLNSRKGRELEAHAWAAATFWWAELERQVRVEGRIEPVEPAEADAYFASRPRGSQLGAWASDQSEPIAGREVLERRWAELEAQYAGQSVPRPPHWGGLRLVPDRIELWQGRPSRLHDRLVYEVSPEANGGWQRLRLAP